MQILTRLGSSLKGIGKEFSSVPGMLVVNILATLGFTVVLLQCLLWIQAPSGIISKLVAATGIGIGAALLSRMTLRQNSYQFRWLSALAATLASLLFINYFTLFRTAGLQGTQTVPGEWDGLWQAVLGGGISLITLLGWGAISLRKPEKSAHKKTIARKYKKFKLPPQSAFVDFPGYPRIKGKRIAQKQTKTIRKGPAVKQPGISLDRTSKAPPKTTARLPQPAIGTQPALKITRPKAAGEKSARPAKAATMRAPGGSIKNGIRLVGGVDHRCPYCLEPVDVHDPAGVVVCEICHSYHHKSCWDVTGTCQVPHLHE